MEEIREFGWNDEIEKEGSDFILLPEGDYEFTVKKFERARFDGSENLPACNKAIVTFSIESPEGNVELKDNYLLISKFEWKLSQLFLALGLKKRGERLKMNWAAITGKKGKCHIFVDTYTKKDGTEGKSNKIKKKRKYCRNILILMYINT